MERENRIHFGNYLVDVYKEPVIFFTGYTDWRRRVNILNTSGEVIMSFTINDVDSQILATVLYMYYSDQCFNPEFNPDPMFDPNFGADVILDYDLLEVINPLVCEKYDINLLLEAYNGWGIVNINIPPTNVNLDRYYICIEGHNAHMKIQISHINKDNLIMQQVVMETDNMEEIYSLSQIINDDLDSLVTNFINNNI